MMAFDKDKDGKLTKAEVSDERLHRLFDRADADKDGFVTKQELTALAEPNRKRIIELLREGPQPVGEIVVQLKLRQPQVSKHLRVLSNAGLVEVQPVAQQRYYSLRPQAFQELASWVESYRRIWDERMDRFDEVLQDLQRKEKRHAHN